MENLIKIGSTLKPHGIVGELKLRVEEHFIDDLFEAAALMVDIKGQKVPYFIEEVQEGNAMILKLEGVDTRSSAELLAHKEIYLRRQDIALTDEQILSGGMEYKHLEGYKIVDNNLGEIGVIHRIEFFPQQEIAYITYQEKEFLIPMNETFILREDNAQKIVFMDLPEGLLDL